MNPFTALTAFLLLTAALTASAHTWDEWLPPENRTSLSMRLMRAGERAEDPITNPDQPTKAQHDAMIAAGGEWKLGSECVSLLDGMPAAVFQSPSLYETDDQPYTAALGFKQASFAHVAVLETIALLEKDGFKLGRESSATYARALKAVCGARTKPVMGNADVDALRKLFRTRIPTLTAAEEAFCKRIRAELDVLRQRYVQCAFVVSNVGTPEQKAKAALYLKIMGYGGG